MRFRKANMDTVQEHPDFSSDLAQCDYYMFPKVGISLQDEDNTR